MIGGRRDVRGGRARMRGGGGGRGEEEAQEDAEDAEAAVAARGGGKRKKVSRDTRQSVGEKIKRKERS